MIRKIATGLLFLTFLGGWAMLEVARWPAYQAAAHWLLTDQVVRVEIPTSRFLLGFGVAAISALGIWLLNRSRYPYSWVDLPPPVPQ